MYIPENQQVIKFDFYVMLLQHLPDSFVATLKHNAMSNLKTLVVLVSLGLFLFSCEEDDNGNVTPVTLDAGTLSGGPFTFAVDGVADMVSGITLSDFDGNGDTDLCNYGCRS